MPNAGIELAIHDLKHGAGLVHCPSGVYSANAAWLLATTLAHNLIRWTQLLGAPPTTPKWRRGCRSPEPSGGGR